MIDPGDFGQGQSGRRGQVQGRKDPEDRDAEKQPGAAGEHVVRKTWCWGYWGYVLIVNVLDMSGNLDQLLSFYFGLVRGAEVRRRNSHQDSCFRPISGWTYRGSADVGWYQKNVLRSTIWNDLPWQFEKNWVYLDFCRMLSDLAKRMTGFFELSVPSLAEAEAGVTEPLGFFDPAGFCKDVDKAGGAKKNYRIWSHNWLSMAKCTIIIYHS